MAESGGGSDAELMAWEDCGAGMLSEGEYVIDEHGLPGDPTAREIIAALLEDPGPCPTGSAPRMTRTR